MLEFPILCLKRHLNLDTTIYIVPYKPPEPASQVYEVRRGDVASTGAARPPDQG